MATQPRVNGKVFGAAAVAVGLAVAFSTLTGMVGFGIATDPLPPLAAFVIWYNRQPLLARREPIRDVSAALFKGVAVAEFLLTGIIFFFWYAPFLELLLSPFISGAFSAALFVLLESLFPAER